MTLTPSDEPTHLSSLVLYKPSIATLSLNLAVYRDPFPISKIIFLIQISPFLFYFTSDLDFFGVL